MVKHTQTICPQQPKNCLSVFDHFVGLALKALIIYWFSFWPRGQQEFFNVVGSVTKSSQQNKSKKLQVRAMLS